jgi:benzoyl-CoA 2,3-dioxygenase component B
MLTEEAHHMFVGETGVQRVVKRACELMKARGTDQIADVRAQGGIDLPTIQRFVNYWFSYSLDLFGSEISSNAADFFAAGLKGRWKEEKYEDHVALGVTRPIVEIEGDTLTSHDVALRNAMNEVLRDEYVDDCEKVLEKWNKALSEEGEERFRITLPNIRFHRRQGIYSDHAFDPAGNPISAEAWRAAVAGWLPTDADRAYVRSLMTPVYEPGKMANWIAVPRRGINNMPLDHEYVRR